MKKKITIYLLLKYENEWIFYTNICNKIKKKHIETRKSKIISKDLNNFLKKELKAHKSRYKTIFVWDINAVKAYFLEEGIEFNEFIYNGSIYNITFKDENIKNKRIIFKNYYHFINSNIIYANNNLLNLFIYIYNKFEININAKGLFSIPAISQKIWLNILKKENKNKNFKRSSLKEYNFIKKAYFGGRNEIYQHYAEHDKNNNIYYYDINSLYPFIMQNYDLPIGKPIFKEKATMDDITNNLGFLEVEISFDSDNLPILPIKMESKKYNMGIIYPRGTFKGIYFTEELKLALQKGYIIINIGSGYFYNSGNLFHTFVDKIYTLKQKEKSKFRKKILKNLMNKLYGRFAVHYKQKIIVEELGKKESYIRSKFLNIAISASISAFARIYIYNLIENHQQNLLYWDTDGIFIKNVIFETSSALGRFRLVDEISKVTFIANKMYIYQNMKNNCKYTLSGIQLTKYKSLIYNPTFASIFLDKLKNSFLQKAKTAQFVTDINKLIFLEFMLKFPLKESRDNEYEIKNFTVTTKRRICIAEKAGKSIVVTQPWHIIQR